MFVVEGEQAALPDAEVQVDFAGFCLEVECGVHHTLGRAGKSGVVMNGDDFDGELGERAEKDRLEGDGKGEAAQRVALAHALRGHDLGRKRASRASQEEPRVLGIGEVYQPPGWSKFGALEETLQHVLAVDAVKGVGHVDGEPRLGGAAFGGQQGLDHKVRDRVAVRRAHSQLDGGEILTDGKLAVRDGDRGGDLVENFAHSDGSDPLPARFRDADEPGGCEEVLATLIEVAVDNVVDEPCEASQADIVFEQRQEQVGGPAAGTWRGTGGEAANRGGNLLGRDDGSGGVGWQAREGVGVRALGVEVVHVADESVVVYGVGFLLGEALDRAAQVPVPHMLHDTLQEWVCSALPLV